MMGVIVQQSESNLIQRRLCGADLGVDVDLPAGFVAQIPRPSRADDYVHRTATSGERLGNVRAHQH